MDILILLNVNYIKKKVSKSYVFMVSESVVSVYYLKIIWATELLNISDANMLSGTCSGLIF